VPGELQNSCLCLSGCETYECGYWLQDREEAGLLEQVKAQICENITMYAQKYDEEFCSHLPNFVTTVWNLLITTGSHVKYDQVNGRSQQL